MPAKTPAECDTLFGEFVNSANLDGLLSLYEDGATLVGPDGTPATGKAQIRASLESASLGDAEITMNVVQQFSGGTDIAVLFNDWKLSARGPDGNPVHLAFGAIEVVRRQGDGTWKFVIDHPYAISK